MRRSRAVADENLRLNEHLQEEVEEKTKQLRLLLSERSQLMTELGHDMKSPLTSISNMAQIIYLNNILLDDDTRLKMENIDKQCGEIGVTSDQGKGTAFTIRLPLLK